MKSYDLAILPELLARLSLKPYHLHIHPLLTFLPVRNLTSPLCHITSLTYVHAQFGYIFIRLRSNKRKISIKTRK